MAYNNASAQPPPKKNPKKKPRILPERMLIDRSPILSLLPAGVRRASTAITMPLPPEYLACEPNSSLRVPQWNRRAITLTIHVSRARDPKQNPFTEGRCMNREQLRAWAQIGGGILLLSL